jgi:hypothetical protein
MNDLPAAQAKENENTNTNPTRQTRSTTRALAASNNSCPSLFPLKSSTVQLMVCFAAQFSPVPNPRKRKLLRNETEGESQPSKEDVQDASPGKRPRLQKEQDIHVPEVIDQAKRPKPRPVRKYHAKTSSSPPARERPTTTRTRVTRMKAKDGKTATATAPWPAKQPPPVNKDMNRQKLREIIQLSSDGEGEHTEETSRKMPSISKVSYVPFSFNNASSNFSCRSLDNPGGSIKWKGKETCE